VPAKAEYRTLMLVAVNVPSGSLSAESRTGQFRPFACTLEIYPLLMFMRRPVDNRLSTLLPARSSCATRHTIAQGLFEDEQPGSGSHNR